MPPKQKNIFSPEYLNEYSSSFKISDVSGIGYKREIIQDWIEDLNCGKLDSLKEEEIKSRFLNEIFGEVLEFSYWNSRHWFLREETKSKVDGTKPDGTLGYFTKVKENDDVRAVVEIKDAKTNLDSKQKRDGNKTPVDQAFEYAPKMGGTCKWVIISNFKEIRFYAANDRTKYQVYFLADLLGDPLREFLFLFQKERFISQSRKSKTDKFYDFVLDAKATNPLSKHILDELYECLYKFKGLGFVDPDYLCNLYPFNILDEQVWHYDNEVLLTNNSRIFGLLSEIEFNDSNFTLSTKLSDELAILKIDDAIFKLGYIFEYLNKCNIFFIRAVKDYMAVYKEKEGVIGRSYHHPYHFNDDQGVVKCINIIQDRECDCYVCNFRNLELSKILTKLKMTVGNNEKSTLELGYGNYLTANNNFKTGFTVYKLLEKNKIIEGKGIEYFVTRLNEKRLFNLIKNNYPHEDRKVILDHIKSVNVDKVIHDELEFEIDSEVREYLINVKENKLNQRIKDKVKELNIKIDELKKSYEKPGTGGIGSNFTDDLMEQYFLLYRHYNLNFLVGDIFKEYKDIVKDIFIGLINSFLTPKVGLKSFSHFFIQEVIIHFNSSELEKATKQLENINISPEGVTEIIKCSLNYFESFYRTSNYSFGVYENDLMRENLLNVSFRNRISAIFYNICLILSKTEFNKEEFKVLEKPIVNFLQTEDFLYHFNLEKLCHFIMQKGNFFEPATLLEILQTAINKDVYSNIKYNHLIASTCLALKKYYPENVISNQSLVKKAMANCYSGNGSNIDFKSYCFILKIVDSNCQNIVRNEIDSYLDSRFDDILYGKLLWEDLYDYSYKNYFDIYVETINNSMGSGVRFKDGKIDWTNLDFVFFNFALLVHAKKITLSDFQREKLKDLSDYEKWLLDPLKFDYSRFNVCWMSSIHRKSIFLNELKEIEQIKNALQVELRREYSQELSEIYVKYFI